MKNMYIWYLVSYAFFKKDKCICTETVPRLGQCISKNVCVSVYLYVYLYTKILKLQKAALKTSH